MLALVTGEGCRGVIGPPPGGRMEAASDQVFHPALVRDGEIVAEVVG